jgi:hypothetical protein
MLTGTALVSKVDELQAQEPPVMLTDIVRACGYEIDGKLNYTKFYVKLLAAKDAVKAFLTIWEESDLEHFEDAYQGCYDSESDFAEQFTTDCYGLNVPSFVVIDWQATWDQGLRYDYEFVDGAVFSSTW